MRLAEKQRETVREEVRQVFGDDALVRLFGSRIDDSARGGDIDLHIEVRGTPSQLLDYELRLKARLLRRLGDRRIDVVVYGLETPLRPIDVHARQTGIRL